MSEFVKTGVLGGYRPVAGGHSDPECTHVILTKGEYDQILQEKAQAEQTARTTRYDADREIREAQRNADYKVQQAAQEAQKAIDGMEGALAAERAESAHQRALNANLLRIAKERANADRGIKPKKERPGYVVVYSQEKEYSFRDGRKRLYKETLWETIIQSPYSVAFAESVARKQIEDELFPEGKEWLIAKVGVTGKYNGSYEKMQEAMEQTPEDLFYQGNVVIGRQQRLKRNFRSNYWEVAIVHTKPLGDIPEDLIPEEKKPVQGD